MKQKLALALGVVLLGIVLAEIGLRVFLPISYREPPSPRPGDVWRELIHRPSPVPGLAYELIPGATKHSHGAVIRTNSFGMRDDEPADGEPPRIVVLGDSFTFGFGVPGEDTYPNVLERLLQEGETRGAEVLNLGVAGYSTRDEAVALERKALRWRPRLVVVGYYLNDPEIDPIQPLHAHYHDPAWWQRFHLGRLVAKARVTLAVRRRGSGDYFRYLHHPGGRKWESVVAAFASMARVSRQEALPVLVVIFPHTTGAPWSDYPYGALHAQVAEAAAGMGLEVLDLLDAWSGHEPADLILDPGNSHPGVYGHETAAQAIHRWIRGRPELVRALSSPRSP